jgi:hypothetical protein
MGYHNSQNLKMLACGFIFRAIIAGNPGVSSVFRGSQVMSADTDELFVPKVLRVHLKLAQYPISSKTIRERMRRRFSPGGSSARYVRVRSLPEGAPSQKREGLIDPFAEEDPSRNERIHTIQSLTDFYFAYNLPHQF